MKQHDGVLLVESKFNLYSAHNIHGHVNRCRVHQWTKLVELYLRISIRIYIA